MKSRFVYVVAAIIVSLSVTSFASFQRDSKNTRMENSQKPNMNSNAPIGGFALEEVE